jgi:hypothetical protein
VFYGIGLVEVPANCTRGEMLDIIRKGREMFLQLESINLCPIQPDKVNDFWTESLHIIEGLVKHIM